ncbi:hypothetical protein [Aquisphaera insulae]|uniref:hypothetical protein n=1 Tax=Aquisphaera insulae TaxID=2712864 RepID=UPI0013EBCB67|nr:hypothetical protein [Aquisphaera insulae]
MAISSGRSGRSSGPCSRALAAMMTVMLGAGDAGAGDVGPTQREIVLRAMRDRPGDPWPRGRAHVVLAVPGSQQAEKGYLEPGGSASPAVGSFGVSIWGRDAAGNLRTTSDGVPMDGVRQRLSWPNPGGIPSIATTTTDYEATWSCRDSGDLVLDLAPQGNGGRLEVAVRSVGPAGGPITKIAFDDGSLTVNDRWAATIDPAPVAVAVGHEGDPGWRDGRTSSRRWEGSDGWGFARLGLEAGRPARLTLHQLARRQPSPLRYPAVRSTLELNLPDPRFKESLDAQVAHLMMGLLDRGRLGA